MSVMMMDSRENRNSSTSTNSFHGRLLVTACFSVSEAFSRFHFEEEERKSLSIFPTEQPPNRNGDEHANAIDATLLISHLGSTGISVKVRTSGRSKGNYLYARPEWDPGAAPEAAGAPGPGKESCPVPDA